MSYKIRQADENGVMRDVTVNGTVLRGFDFPTDSVELKEFDEKTRSFLAVASTEASDRVADKVHLKGIELDNYMKNPVVMWAHDYRSLPLGISLDIEKNTRKKQLIFRPSFDDHEFAVKVYNSYLKRIMRGFSIGALPLEFERRSEDDMTDEEKMRAGFFGGWDFNRSELLEVSAAPIPMNPDALSAMKSIGIDKVNMPSDLGLENSKSILANGSIWIPIVDCSTFVDIKTVSIDENVKVVSGKPLGSSGSDVVIQRVLGYIFPKGYTDEKIAEWFVNKGLSNETANNFLQFSEKQNIKPLVLTIENNKTILKEVLESKENPKDGLSGNLPSTSPTDGHDNINPNIDPNANKQEEVMKEIKDQLVSLKQAIATLVEQYTTISKVVDALKAEFEVFKQAPPPSDPTEDDESGILSLIEEVASEREEVIELTESTLTAMKEIFAEIFTANIDAKIATALEESLRGAYGEIKEIK